MGGVKAAGKVWNERHYSSVGLGSLQEGTWSVINDGMTHQLLEYIIGAQGHGQRG